MASEIKNPLQLYVAGENASTYFSRFFSLLLLRSEEYPEGLQNLPSGLRPSG